MSLTRPPEPADVDRRCLMCGSPAGDQRLCSRTCVQQASREVETNVSELRTGGHASAADQQGRATLTARNGELTDALIRWHP